MPAPSSRSGRGKPIGEMLIEAGTITPEQLARAISEQNSNYDLIGRILIRIGACDQTAILNTLQAQYRVTMVDIGRISIDPQAIGKVDKDVCEKNRLVPFDLIGNTLCVAMTNVLNRKAITDIEEVTKCKVKPFSAPWMEVKKVVDAYFLNGGKGMKLLKRSPDEAMPPPVEVMMPPVSVVPKAAPAAQKSVSSMMPKPQALTAPKPGVAPAAKSGFAPAVKPVTGSFKPAPAIEVVKPMAPVVSGPAITEEPEVKDDSSVSVVPFSGRASKRQKKPGKHDTMKILKAQLMKDKGPDVEPDAPVKDDIVTPSEIEPAAVAVDDTAPPPVEIALPPAQPPRFKTEVKLQTPKSVGPAATVAYGTKPEWVSYPAPPAEDLVPVRLASGDAEPAIVKKLRERGQRGSADHEIMDALPVAERFAPSLEEYKVTVSALAAIENVSPVEAAPKPPTTRVAAHPVPALAVPSIAAGDKIRKAIALSAEEVNALMSKGPENRDAGFRARFLSTNPAKAIIVG